MKKQIVQVVPEAHETCCDVHFQEEKEHVVNTCEDDYDRSASRVPNCIHYNIEVTENVEIVDTEHQRFVFFQGDGCHTKGMCMFCIIGQTTLLYAVTDSFQPQSQKKEWHRGVL
jgi:hypothetical protein